MYRRLLFVFSLALIFGLSISACSKKNTADTTANSPDVEKPAPKPDPATEVTEKPVEKAPVETMKMPVLEDVFFAFDSSALSSDAKSKLQNNAKQLKDASMVDVTIEGHCDERGTIAYNLALGERRAKAAKDYLVSLGVSANRMTIISYGKERPFDPGHTEAAWAKNRRAHFVVDQN